MYVNAHRYTAYTVLIRGYFWHGRGSDLAVEWGGSVQLDFIKTLLYN